MRKLSLLVVLLTLFISACTSAVEFKISFDSNGGSFVEPIITDGVSSITTPKDPLKEGFTFAGWYWDNNTFRELFTINSLLDRGITNDLTVYAKWELDDDYIPIGSVKVTFNTQGGTEVSPVYVLPGRTILIPSTTREGYTLDGWYTSVNNGATLDERWSFTNNVVSNDITLYAKWNVNIYSITFNSNGGTALNSISKDYDSIINLPNNPLREGYTFDGWFEDDNLSISFDIEKMPSKDFTLYAKWTINQYTITFDSNGGTEVESISQNYATTVTEPVDTTRKGYTFDGWYTDSTLTKRFTFTTMPANDLNLYGKWNIVTYDINYELGGGTNDINNPTTFNVNSNYDLFEPTKLGYTFEGWYLDSDFTGNKISNITVGTTGNLFLYAKWTINSYNITYTIFDLNYDPLSSILLNVDETIIQVSLGGAHSSALTSSGRLFTWGDNEYGQLGDETTIQRNTPIDITASFNLNEDETIIQVSLGGAHSSALTSTGRLFTWGDNEYGQLGDETTIQRNTPTDITASFNLNEGETIIQVSLGGYHSSVLTSTGRLFTWGWNVIGELGDGTTIQRNTPTDTTASFNLNEGETIIQVSLGGVHSSVLTSTGRLFTWGWNPYGQLGDGSKTNRNTPKDITASFNLNEDETIIQVSLSRDHSAALTSKGRLFAWGSNVHGELGDGTSTDQTTPKDITASFNLNQGETLIQVSLGGYHSSALTSTGHLFTWGSNVRGQLGDGTTTSQSVPKQLSINSVYSYENIVYIFNEKLSEIIPVIEGYSFEGWFIDSALTNAYTFTTMPAEDLTLYGKWNIVTYDINYELGGGTNDINNPTSFNVDSSINLLEPTKIGHTFAGWYTQSDFSGNVISNIVVGTTGNLFLYAKWTINSYNITYTIFDLNYDPLSSILLNVDETIIQVSLGGSHSFALTSTGRLFTWGDNEYGQLGDETTTQRNTPIDITASFNLNEDETIIRVSLGGYHSSALTSTGRLFTWGWNSDGRLGDGTTTQRNTPIDITASFNLNEDETITQVSLGGFHSSALTSTGRLFTWGRNSDGQLGDGTTTQRNTPTDITASFNLNEDETIIRVSLGGYHSSALTSTGRLFTWGLNFFGTLGDGTTTDRTTPVEIMARFNLSADETITQVSLGGAHSAALTSKGRLFTWGYNFFGFEDGTPPYILIPMEINSLFIISTGETVNNVSLGYRHSSILTSNGRLFTWGFNANGQLGDGSTTETLTPIEINSSFNLTTGETITQVSLGDTHSIALSSSGRLFTWGNNFYGQLGDGTTSNQTTPTQLSTMSVYSDENIVYKLNENISDYIPLRDGYIFEGWYFDTEFTIQFNLTNMPAQDLILYGKWIPKED